VSSVARKLIIAALAAAALLWPRPAIAPIAAQQSPLDSVRVETELIEVVPARNKVPALLARTNRAVAVKLATVQKPVTRPSSPGVVGRARRMLLGDGRYRPEPFPRPGR
jgi:hypothetical protein